MSGVLITPGALHALLTDAHIAMVEHRPDFASAVLHVLRKATAPAEPQGLARRLDDTAFVAGGGDGGRGKATAPTGEAAKPPVPEAATAAPPTFHAPALADLAAQPAHQHHLPRGPGAGLQPPPDPPPAPPPPCARWQRRRGMSDLWKPARVKQANAALDRLKLLQLAAEKLKKARGIELEIHGIGWVKVPCLAPGAVRALLHGEIAQRVEELRGLGVDVPPDGTPADA